MTDAEQAFEEWCLTEGYQSEWTDVHGIAKEAYLAATERTARRCVEICDTQELYSVPGCTTNRLKHRSKTSDECVRAIAKEFGLD